MVVSRGKKLERQTSAARSARKPPIGRADLILSKGQKVMFIASRQTPTTRVSRYPRLSADAEAAIRIWRANRAKGEKGVHLEIKKNLGEKTLEKLLKEVSTGQNSFPTAFKQSIKSYFKK